MNIITNPVSTAKSLYLSLRQSESALYDRILYVAQDALIDDRESEFLAGISSVNSDFEIYKNIEDMINFYILPRMAQNATTLLQGVPDDIFDSDSLANAWINSRYLDYVGRVTNMNNWLNTFEMNSPGVDYA